MSRGRWQQQEDELARALERREIDDAQWFAGMASIFEAAYLRGGNPRAQSGFGGDEARWETARRPVADAIDSDGTFLDIGSANGHLLERIVAWSSHRIEPFGLELVPALAELARRRLPQWADRFFVGNALTWEPPRRFDFVRTELVYVPPQRRRVFLERLLGRIVEPGGRLIVCGYGSPRSGLRADPVRAIVRSHGFAPELEREVEAPEGGGPIIELAVLRAPSARASRAG
ncbi:MAG: class I SAM-dependent methyltransferase [Gaiellaceae bacterium]